ncbi:unnamed protein product [Lactuca saligna]|uniref:Uncharacterized protein n=1 Tax=Lactuca saligna TaxID=75948 RepID=A0AA35VT61_LACSI|nr:unnamed protein product [Lactuca saligna]
MEYVRSSSSHNEFACGLINDIYYVAAQTSSFMVSADDRVRLAGASQGQLKVLQGALACIRKEGVVCVIDKVIESVEFAKGVHDVHEACESLGFKKGRQLSGCSRSSSKSEVSGPSQVASMSTEVNSALTSFVETHFVGLFHLGELDYDEFLQFCGKLIPGGSSSDSEG